MSIQVEVKYAEVKCKDFGRPGCLSTPDDQYTLYFHDIGEAPIYFCSSCGPLSRTLLKIFEDMVREDGEDFLQKLDAEISKAEKEHRDKLS